MQSRLRILDGLVEWYGKVWRCAFEILHYTIPSYLSHMLVSYSVRATPQRTLRLGRVYDLLNCGPRNRFTVGDLIVHNCQFGAGVAKVMESLEAEEVYLPEEQVATIHRTYWETFRELKQYSWDLQREWKLNGGYVLNGLGRPMCVTQDYKKDLLSRVVQSTGHDLLTIYCSLVRDELNHALPGQWKPVIWDWHDAVTVEVPEADGEYAASILEYCVGKLNELVAGTIQLRGKAVIGRNLAEVKECES